jgi:hypothetical protein
MYSHKDHCLKFGDLIITHTLIIYLNHDFTRGEIFYIPNPNQA